MKATGLVIFEALGHTLDMSVPMNSLHRFMGSEINRTYAIYLMEYSMSCVFMVSWLHLAQSTDDFP